MIRWIARKFLDRPINVFPGDTVSAVYHGSDGRYEELTTNVDSPLVVTELAIGEVENDLEFKKGLLVVFGEAKK